ncbi:D-alanyl-D-alanine carboxypeptidase family protein, partial [Methylobacterium trifolii]
MRSVPSRSRTAPAIPAALLAAAVLTALASPAEARRRGHHARTGGGYNPPYAAMVVDVKSGKTLHAVNEDALRHPASITKVMTLYMLFEQMEKGRFALDSELTISARAAAQAPSKLGLRPGSTIEVEDAIKAIVTKSANDVACAIGENISGSEERFAQAMTAKAHALGMSRTNYANASGLPDADQVTTARDLTILARAIQDRFPRYYRYFQTRAFAFRGRTIGNHNHLLGRVEGVDGIKTGYTRDSGFNLMTAAKSDDRQIVAIVLGGKSGASRDRIMADLVRASLPRAYAGARQAPAAVEVA